MGQPQAASRASDPAWVSSSTVPAPSAARGRARRRRRRGAAPGDPMTRIETAVILATELVGSKPLARRIGNAGSEDLRREHDAMLGHDIEDHGGRVIKHTGDGLLASFPSVTAA